MAHRAANGKPPIKEMPSVMTAVDGTMLNDMAAAGRGGRASTAACVEAVDAAPEAGGSPTLGRRVHAGDSAMKMLQRPPRDPRERCGGHLGRVGVPWEIALTPDRRSARPGRPGTLFSTRCAQCTFPAVRDSRIKVDWCRGVRTISSLSTRTGAASTRLTRAKARLLLSPFPCQRQLAPTGPAASRPR